MSTTNELIDATLDMFSGFLREQESATHVTAPVFADSLVLNVADPSPLSRGIAEIGHELIWIDSVAKDGTVTVAPYGRGYRSTDVGAYEPGTRIVQAPRMPRSMVKRYLDEAVSAVFPRLFAVRTVQADWTFRDVYRLPLEPGDGEPLVLSASKQPPVIRSIELARSWRVGPVQSDEDGTFAELYLPFGAGTGTVTIMYRTQPGRINDRFTDTGLPASCEDVIRLGAAYRIAPFLDVTEVGSSDAEAQFNASTRSYGAGIKLGQHLFQLYQVRLGEEERALQVRFPAKVRFQG